MDLKVILPMSVEEGWCREMNTTFFVDPFTFLTFAFFLFLCILLYKIPCKLYLFISTPVALRKNNLARSVRWIPRFFFFSFLELFYIYLLSIWSSLLFLICVSSVFLSHLLLLLWGEIIFFIVPVVFLTFTFLFFIYSSLYKLCKVYSCILPQFMLL